MRNTSVEQQVFLIDMNKPAPVGLRSRRLAGATLALCALIPATGASAALEADRQLSTDGVVQLHWALDGRPVELQRAADAGFAAPRTLYRGTDSASLRSGLPDGQYYFRVRAEDAAPDAWSEVVGVTVRHHGAARTWALFGLGATVFVAVLGLILWGYRRESRDG